MADRGRHGRKIENVHWTYGSATQGGVTAGVGGETVYTAQHLPETLLRVRGEWVGYLDGVSAPGSAIAVGVGLILVPEGTGSTVLWSPITDGDAPWLWVDYTILAYEEYVVDVSYAPGMTNTKRVIDNKAMRRIRNQEVQFVVENATILTADAVNVFANFRALFGN